MLSFCSACRYVSYGYLTPRNTPIPKRWAENYFYLTELCSFWHNCGQSCLFLYFKQLFPLYLSFIGIIGKPKLRGDRGLDRLSSGNISLWEGWIMYLDPSIMGASFSYKTEVYINNQMVPTNSAVGGLFQQYVRCARIYNSRAKHYFATNSDITNVIKFFYYFLR